MGRNAASIRTHSLNAAVDVRPASHGRPNQPPLDIPHTAATRLSRAERRERTPDDLIAAADRCFVEGGFHATTLDQIAAAAGYTKGAVYSNFASKEDRFFAVYERRADRAEADVARLLADDPRAGLRRLSADTSGWHGRDDGWLAAFFEFWAHAIRNPEFRARFASIHRRLQIPVAALPLAARAVERATIWALSWRA
jgi:AcrR family transcriptional regulator